MKEKISRNKISRHYKSFFGLENMGLGENDNLMIDWGESLVNDFCNQEVEKRIAERMPSKMTFEKAEIAAKETDYACFAVEPGGNKINFADAAAFYLEGWNACRSRLLLTQNKKKDKQQVDN